MNTPATSATAPQPTHEIWGNWKMNPTSVPEAEALARETVDALRSLIAEDPRFGRVNVGVFVPYIFLPFVGAIVKSQYEEDGTRLLLGVQTMHYNDKGAFTGETSPLMIKSALSAFGATPTVLIGHSERRQMGENDVCVNKKMLAAYKYGLRPFMCIGETKEERSTGSTNSVLERQLRMGLADVNPEEFAKHKTVIAYEPVWAIGTGLTATREQANDAHEHVRGVLADMLGIEVASQTKIQYGGSMKPENAPELLSMEHIDGGLIGGAALSAQSFIGIVKAVPQVLIGLK